MRFLYERAAHGAGIGTLASSGSATNDQSRHRQRIISKALDAWADWHAVRLEFSRPDKPTDNGFIESFKADYGRSV
jgi:transposase InsO family protein